MKKITLLFAFLVTSVGFSQEVLQGFETSTGVINGAAFGQMASPNFIAGSGTNTTQVLEIIGNPAGDVWQGVTLNLTKNVQLTTSKTMSIDVKSAAPITFLVKVKEGVAGAQEASASASYTGNGEWQTVSFTFDTVLDGKAATANGVYTAFVIHTYWEAGVTDFANVTRPARTFYVDNVTGPAAPASTCGNGVKDGDETGVDCGGSCPACDFAPTTAAPTPQLQNASGVASIFCNQYTNIAINEWPTAWSNGTSTNVQIAGDDTKKLKLTDYIGIDFQSSPINATDMDRWHMDFWVKEDNLPGKVLNIKLIDFGGTGGEVNPTFVYHLENVSTNPVIESGRWVTIDLPLQGTNKSDIKQAVIQSNMLGSIYIDNFYLYNSKLGAKSFESTNIKMYPNPASNRLTIEAQNTIENVSLYNVLGQEVIVKSPKSQSTTLDISSLQNGVYIVKTTINGVTSSSRIIKK